MDIGKSFTYMFEDPDWLRKLGIATVLALVGLVLSFILIGLIPLIIVAGYTLQVTRNVLDGETRPLPDWNDWQGFLSSGFKLVIVFLVWSLPGIIISVPAALFAALLGDGGGEGAQTMVALVSICGSCVAILWSLVIMLFSPAIYVRVARANSIASGFDFSRLWAFTRENISNVIVALLLVIVAYIIGSIVAPLGVIAIVIGLLITVPFGVMVFPMLVQAHLYGQVGQRSTSVLD